MVHARKPKFTTVNRMISTEIESRFEKPSLSNVNYSSRAWTMVYGRYCVFSLETVSYYPKNLVSRSKNLVYRSINLVFRPWTRVLGIIGHLACIYNYPTLCLLLIQYIQHVIQLSFYFLVFILYVLTFIKNENYVSSNEFDLECLTVSPYLLYFVFGE